MAGVVALGAILAGGHSSRMGQEKALILWRGQTLISRVIGALREALGEVLIVGRDPGWGQAEGSPCIPDDEPDLGPLGGLRTALHHSGGRPVFLAGCDMPLLVPEAVRLVASLLEDYDAAIPSIGGRLQPVHAIYSPACLTTADELLHTSRRSMHGMVKLIRVRIITEDELRSVDSTLQSCWSVNTPDDLMRVDTDDRS